MIIGIPKEIKNNENRVALTPSGAQELTKRGHKVYVQASAGVNSGFADDAYTAVGAEILPTIGDVYARAEMIVKVKEPIAPEYKLIRKDQLVFTFFHFASSEPLTRAMIDSGAVCCAYETVERADRSLPLLIPMSEVAGRMSTQEGRYFLEKPRGGKGKLLVIVCMHTDVFAVFFSKFGVFICNRTDLFRVKSGTKPSQPDQHRQFQTPQKTFGL